MTNEQPVILTLARSLSPSFALSPCSVFLLAFSSSTPSSNGYVRNQHVSRHMIARVSKHNLFRMWVFHYFRSSTNRGKWLTSFMLCAMSTCLMIMLLVFFCSHCVVCSVLLFFIGCCGALVRSIARALFHCCLPLCSFYDFLYTSYSGRREQTKKEGTVKRSWSDHWTSSSIQLGFSELELEIWFFSSNSIVMKSNSLLPNLDSDKISAPSLNNILPLYRTTSMDKKTY